MTTPLMHLGAAVLTLLLIRRLLSVPISDRFLLFASTGAIMPDIVDKLITGTRYPIHSLALMAPLILVVNILYYKKYPSSSSSKYLILFFSIAMFTHPFMDLEQPIPLFYPLILDGFSLNFSLIIQQGFPPMVTDFTFELVQSPFNYELFTPHEGIFFSASDILLISILFSSILLAYFVKELFSSNERILVESFQKSK